MIVNFVGSIYVEQHAIAGIAPKFGITIHMAGRAESIIRHGGGAGVVSVHGCTHSVHSAYTVRVRVRRAIKRRLAARSRSL